MIVVTGCKATSLRGISCTFIVGMSTIQFFYQKSLHSLRNRADLKHFLQKTAHSYKKEIQSLNVVFCSDAYLLNINQQHLSHDYYTDIITFDLSEKKGILQAEIYISVDRVKENARKLGTPFYQELHRVIFHGLLHLLGYNDKQSSDQKKMRKAEDELLSSYFG
ncbi:MAG: rRNA maturation RNase YbeY [Bacteroidota bacterium]|jgi:rRNA maturation RNase YbeY